MTSLLINANALHIPPADKSVNCVVTSPPEEFKSFIEDGETIEIAICKLYIQWREVMQ